MMCTSFPEWYGAEVVQTSDISCTLKTVFSLLSKSILENNSFFLPFFFPFFFPLNWAYSWENIKWETASICFTYSFSKRVKFSYFHNSRDRGNESDMVIITPNINRKREKSFQMTQNTVFYLWKNLYHAVDVMRPWFCTIAPIYVGN